tara:strand:+ start:274 stop:465 length:192 start_codon:yes stop_codon:yes gene_type:complete
MPTLDDAPTVESMTSVNLVGGGDSADVATQLHEDDLVQVYDQSEQKAKVVTVKALAAALNVAL